MKKVILIILSILLSGCSIKEINNENADKIIDKMLSNKVEEVNRTGLGYSYYIPANVNLLEVSGENEVLFSKGCKYYLHIDLISYDRKIKVKYNEDKKLYISRTLVKGDEDGYIEISEAGKQYYVEMTYNYAKIEAYVYDYQLKDSLIDISNILLSVKYNDVIIDSLVNNKVISATNSSDYSIYQPKIIQNNYIENTTEAVTDTSKTINDPDVIETTFND